MTIKSIKTAKITAGSLSLARLLDESISELADGSVVAITSKVAAICENRVVPIEAADKQTLIEQESEYFLSPDLNKYGFSFTISHGTLIPVAGIDESSGNGNYILWPADPQKTASDARNFLAKKFGLKKLGVVITDSTARPLHYGTEGVAISFAGFKPINDYVGKKDLFGRPFKVSMANVPDALASAAVLMMGEGTEQTPLAIIEDLPMVQFNAASPTTAELKQFFVSHKEDDLFRPFLANAPWQKGQRILAEFNSIDILLFISYGSVFSYT
jgi:F420-0:gamma-glutamyl ligase